MCQIGTLLDLHLVKLDLVKFKRPSPRFTSRKKKKCLNDSTELSVVNPFWYLNYIIPEGHHENSTIYFFLRVPFTACKLDEKCFWSVHSKLWRITQPGIAILASIFDSSWLDSTWPQSINFRTRLQLGFGYRALVFASTTNLE